MLIHCIVCAVEYILKTVIHQETIDNIENAFVSLLRDKELNKISVTELCEAAKIDSSTFYANYEDISDLANEVSTKIEIELEEQPHTDGEFAWIFEYIQANNANGIEAADRERIAVELQQLLDEQTQRRAALAEQNVDPELIVRIRYCVDTVIKAGEEPRQRESISAQLEREREKPSAPERKDDRTISRADVR